MIVCPSCKNDENSKIAQLDPSLVGYGEYGRNFICLKCRRLFFVDYVEADEQELYEFNNQ